MPWPEGHDPYVKETSPGASATPLSVPASSPIVPPFPGSSGVLASLPASDVVAGAGSSLEHPAQNTAEARIRVPVAESILKSIESHLQRHEG